MKKGMYLKLTTTGFIDWVDITEAENIAQKNFLVKLCFRIKYSSFEKIISKGEIILNLSNKEYSQLVSKISKPSPKIKDFIIAFLVGGTICVFGQILMEIYALLGLEKNQITMLIPATLVFVAAMLTSFKVFDNIAKRAGAGTLVPITGFANAIASPAIEYKSEGWVLGLGSNIFKLAGPVIVYGVTASVIYGVVYWITTLF
jgi:stage V sporulation protein AC